VTPRRAGAAGWLLAAALALAPVVAPAGEAVPVAADPALERRVDKLSQELRCLVCQNQTIADSRADLAVQLKNQVREQLAAGRSEQQVVDFMTERYGDFVLYRPPLRGTTALLWAGPALLLAGAAWMLLRAIRRQRRPVAEGDAAALSDAERERAAALLGAAAAPADAGGAPASQQSH
jgi:cytochrome c-type biogenesis protein CcmH